MSEAETKTDDSTQAAKITNIFVLMLENHSFDNIFAMSGIDGIKVATTKDSNSWSPPDQSLMLTAHVRDGAPESMPTDPGHEFEDVIEQLCGVKPCCQSGDDPKSGVCDNNSDCYPGGKYPGINMSGFAQNYATSTSEGTGIPGDGDVPNIMACFDTETKLPVIHQLAREFAICDAWHSSLPGPTWPNRFFVHGASSAGTAQSPDMKDEVVWETVKGFEYDKGSIFHALKHGWRLYQDKDNDFSDQPSHWYQGGWISQVASLKGISMFDVHSFRRFEKDLNKLAHDGTPEYHEYPYTFIEPNFGASFFAKQDKDDPGPTYVGGSSQHPEDDPSGGEGLIKAVYDAIRNSPVWETSLLFIVYDEHGGFYDSVPPGPAVPPGDAVPAGQEKLNKWDFDFDRLGVRVPAVVVSPRIKKHTVDHTIYDHSSILATLERTLNMPALTCRDAAANDVLHLLDKTELRDDCPTQLCDPAKLHRDEPANTESVTDTDEALEARLPESGNAIGFLHVLLKTELEMAGDSDEKHKEILENFSKVKTLRHAQDYVRTIKAKMDAASDQPG